MNFFIIAAERKFQTKCEHTNAHTDLYKKAKSDQFWSWLCANMVSLRLCLLWNFINFVLLNLYREPKIMHMHICKDCNALVNWNDSWDTIEHVSMSFYKGKGYYKANEREREREVRQKLRA